MLLILNHFSMNIPSFPFEIIDWKNVPEEKRFGESGSATWQVLHVGGIRIRRLRYSSGYRADHWCQKGHIIHCMEGEMKTELDDGRIMNLKAGNTYIVGEKNEAHRSFTETGCLLFVVD